MPSSNGPSHRQHHQRNFPPQQYNDLRSSDISLLAPILRPSPPRTSPTYAAHEAEIRKRISELPSHLKSKIPLLCPFCAVHKHLNSLPITSIFQCIQNEVKPDALLHWAPVENKTWLDTKTISLLEDMNCVWTNPSSFSANYRRVPNASRRWTFQSHKCAACRLSEIANNVPGMVAVGACIIARLDPRNWKKSKRIQWFEKWIAESVESNDQIEGATKAMWECGVKLRNAMATKETKEGRTYIDDFVAQTRLPLRPAREETQDGHVAFVANSQRDDEDEKSDAESVKTIRQQTPSPMAETPPAATPQPQSEKLPTRYVPSTDFFSRVQRDFHENDSRTLLRPQPPTPTAPARPTSSIYSRPASGYRVASSIYSRAQDDDDDDDARWNNRDEWFRTTILEEGEFIDSYNRPTGNAGNEPPMHGFI